MSVDALHESVSELAVSAVAARPVGAEGEALSTAGVLTDKALESAETLPAASKAATVKAYVVPEARPVIETVVALGDATSAPSRYMR